MGRDVALREVTKTAPQALLLIALAAAWMRQDKKGADEVLPPAPQRPVEGLAGFSSRSTLAWGEDGKQAHQLHCVFVFPERVRINRIDADGQWTSEYRFGGSLFRRVPAEQGSTVPPPEERSAILLQFALRQAAMLWPQTFAWQPLGEKLRAVVGPEGSLEASIGPDGRPLELRALDAGGRTAFALDSFTWREHSRRTWPATMVWWQGGRRLGLETVESASTSIGYVDSYFLPQDRRAPNSTAATHEEVVSIRVGPFAERREALKPSPTWAQICSSLQDRVRLEEQLLREVGYDLGIEVAIEIDGDGQPAATLLRAFGRAQPLPRGWQVVEAYDALACYAPGFDALAGSLRGVRAKLSPEIEPGAAHVRWTLGENPPSKLQLVQPLPRE
jgi:hypothetical protein